jgi:paraquat-inducible protein B
MMARQARAWRVGLFVAAALALLVLAAVLVLGRGVFSAHERVALQFNASVFGLKVAAPVVFKGLRVGQVAGIELAARSGAAPAVQVWIDVDQAALQSMLASLKGAAQDSATGAPLVQALVQRGLIAKLATQSLLTGQLFVELDLRATPGSQALTPALGQARTPADAAGAATQPLPSTVPALSAGAAGPAGAGAGAAGAALALATGPLQIPTQGHAMQALQSQMESLDLGGLTQELKSAAAATRQMAASTPMAPLKATLDEISKLAADLRRVAAKLDAKVEPVGEAARGALSEARSTFTEARTTLTEARGTATEARGTAQRWSQAAGSAASAAEQAGRAAARIEALAAADAPLAQAAVAARRSAEELAQTAVALRSSVGASSPLITDIDRAAREAAAAARSIRALADLLEKHPQSLLLGRPSGAPARPDQSP